MLIATSSDTGAANATPGSLANATPGSLAKARVGSLPSARVGSLVDASAIAALEFLERSREVASERVVDGGRAQTSPSEREEAAAPGSGSPV